MTVAHRVAQVIEKTTQSGTLAGVSTLVWRAGRVEAAVCAGWADVDSRVPVQRDTLFRIASMTKPITTTAALMLLEEGRFRLDDPISKVAPEFSTMRVLRTPDAPLDQTVPAERAITFEHLLTHTAGFTCGPFHTGPIAKAYDDALGGDIDSHVRPDAWIAALAGLPLIDQPGNALHYSHATDLLGLLIARMEGAPLGAVLQRRIFGPLGMKDTGFTVPKDKAARRASMYGYDDAGRMKKVLVCPGGSSVAERPEDMEFVSGGQGLWSTVDDYLAFARMLLGKGTVDGVTLLKPDSVALMMTNRLTEPQRARSDVGGMKLFAKGHGFGLGLAVVTDAGNAMPTVCGGHVGAAGWPGGFGGWWRVDPADQSVMVFLTHNMVERAQFDLGIGFGVYEAITDFQSAAAAA